MDGELNEEEEDTLLLRAYTGQFDQHTMVEEPVLPIESVDNIPLKKEKRKIKKFKQIAESLKGYFDKIEQVKQIILGKSGSMNESFDTLESNSFRYFSLTCNKCGAFGHFSTECPNKKSMICYLCGDQHFSKECPNQLCFRCFTPGHMRKDCEFPQAAKITCFRCSKSGHSSTECPHYFDFEDKEIFCYNCGYPGHPGPTCSDFRADALFDAQRKSDNGYYSHSDGNQKLNGAKYQGKESKKRKSSHKNNKKSQKKKKRKSN